MTSQEIIAASYAAERNYSHNPDDVIDASDAVLAIGTEKVDTNTLKDRSPENNNATIKGAMPTEGFIQGRRFTAANKNYLDCGNDSSLDATEAISMTTLSVPFCLIGNRFHITKSYDIFTRTEIDELTFSLNINGLKYSKTTGVNLTVGKHYYVTMVYNKNVDNFLHIFINGIENSYSLQEDTGGGNVPVNVSNVHIGIRDTGELYNDIIFKYATIKTIGTTLTEHKTDFNTLACLPFWSVNYTDYPDNVTEYTDNLPYSSSIISSGTFKVDDDKLQCVSAGTITYSASYEFDGSEYIKVVIDGVEYAGTGTITQGNTTVSVAQGSNKVTIEMGTGDTIEGEIGIQFREEV